MKVAVGLRRVAAGKRTSGRRAAQIALEEVEPQLEAYAVDLDRKIQRLVREREHVLRQIRWIREILGESNAQ